MRLQLVTDTGERGLVNELLIEVEVSHNTHWQAYVITSESRDLLHV